MLRIRAAQNEELLKRSFRAKLYRFLVQALPEQHRGRVGGLAEMSSMWAKVPWVGEASEHDLAVYMTFVWLATFDPGAAAQIQPPDAALRSEDAVIAMKTYMADAGYLDFSAFDRA